MAWSERSMCQRMNASALTASTSAAPGSTRSSRSKRFWKCRREWIVSTPVIQR